MNNSRNLRRREASLSTRVSQWWTAVPFVTSAIVIVCGLIYTIFLLIGHHSFFQLYLFQPSAVTANFYEVYRFYTSTLFHESIWHLVFNMLALVQIGSGLERILGSLRYAHVLFLIATCNGVLHVLFALLAAHNPIHPNAAFKDDYTVGFSGMVCAMIVMETSLSRVQSHSIFGLFNVPAKWCAWILLAVFQLLMLEWHGLPQWHVLLLGNLCGILSGFAYTYGLVNPLLLGSSTVLTSCWLLASYVRRNRTVASTYSAVEDFLASWFRRSGRTGAAPPSSNSGIENLREYVGSWVSSQRFPGRGITLGGLTNTEFHSRGEAPTPPNLRIPHPTSDHFRQLSNRGGIPYLLSLENACHDEENIQVGVLLHPSPSASLEFVFYNAIAMASCVGVGLPQAKVILHNDLSITIEATTDADDRKLKADFRKPDKICHLVYIMPDKMKEAADTKVHEGVQTISVAQKCKNLLRLYGVGFDSCGSQSNIVDETYDAAEVRWPLLYEMAWFILTNITNDVQCNETNGESSAQGSARSFQGSTSQDSMRDELSRKRDSELNGRNTQGGAGGDGGDQADGVSSNVKGENDLPDKELTVTVYPLSKRYVSDDTNTDGLVGASIKPQLMVIFRLINASNRRIEIKADTQLQLDSKCMDDTNKFGWYQDDIQIEFGCEEGVAGLKANTSRIVNKVTAEKYIKAKSTAFSIAQTLGVAVLCRSGFSDIFRLQGSGSGSRTRQRTTTDGGNYEMERQCICGGFTSVDNSGGGRAKFSLTYPLANYLDIWDGSDREFLRSRGLFGTITPCIEATWIPSNDAEDAPCSFKVDRNLKLHDQISRRGIFRMSERVLQDHTHKQDYSLEFFVNHAMTHLRRMRKNTDSRDIQYGEDLPGALQVNWQYT